MAAIPDPHPGPLSFMGAWGLVYGAALLPAAKLTVETLSGVEISALWAVVLVALAFPALLLPALPDRSRAAVLSAPMPLRTVLAIPPLILGVGLLQISIFELLRDWDGIVSITRLAFGTGASVAGALLLFWTPPRP